MGCEEPVYATTNRLSRHPSW